MERINYSSKFDDWKRFEKNNPTIALNILYTKEKEILPAYISKHNWTFEKQINCLNDSKRRKRRMALSCSKNIICIISQKTSNHEGDFYCLNCLNSFGAEIKLKIHKKICKNKHFCGVEMPSEKIMYWSLISTLNWKKCLISFMPTLNLVKRIEGCANNPQKSSTIKIGEHIPCGYSVSTIWGFDHINCMKKVLWAFKKTCNKNNRI